MNYIGVWSEHRNKTDILSWVVIVTAIFNFCQCHELIIETIIDSLVTKITDTADRCFDLGLTWSFGKRVMEKRNKQTTH